MEDHEFVNGVNAHQGELKAWNQDALVDGRAYMNSGACAQIAALWLRNEKLKAAGQKVPGARESTEEISWMCEQKNKGRQVIDEFLQGNGLKPDSGRIKFTTRLNLDNVIFFVFAKPAYYIMGAINGQNSGHGIALNSTRPVPSLFDPNYGEARFHTREGFKGFLSWYWLEAYPDLNQQGFVMRYC